MGHSAVIIGAGIGGLSTARALKRHGWSVTVLEQAAALPTSGTMLGMWPAAVKALDGIGVDDSRRGAGWAHIAAGAGTRLWTPAGRTLLTAPGGADVHLVSRPALLAALARDIEVSFNTQVIEAEQLDDAELVVGADGTFSRTRQRMFGDRFRARSLGAVAWRGTVKGAVAEYGETWAPGALFGITPAGPDATNWYACIRSDRTFDGPHLPRVVNHFGSWHRGVRELIGRIEENAVLHHGLFETPTLHSFVTGNTALVGDAAHAMAPFLGRGACEAIVDGTTLGRVMAQASAVDAGLAAFNKERRARAQRLVLASRLMGQFAMMDTGSGIRNAAVVTVGRLVKPRPRQDPKLPRR
ncbi:FAD-dependent oxidoreductase [Pseudarthrobacter sp. RMG13]|uniref:FAD-dependent oxidoreductase n=1 Tax=Pseudarthrobacter humi TaxID=2952523 RepID=A0ABT1LQW3_9MICC|nr:FAD-dependent oxidoreductase [Pseudarthrobacter humi]MCP9000843.1 FAD-dependent oxidoreductase [Pseudarthrobacter humi]